MRKKRTIAKSRAASLKTWRTKQRMQEARSMPTADDVVRQWDQIHANTLEARRATDKLFLGIDEPSVDLYQKQWPNYMRRALPNPWLTK
jgi:isocitrate lyase